VQRTYRATLKFVHHQTRSEPIASGIRPKSIKLCSNPQVHFKCSAIYIMNMIITLHTCPTSKFFSNTSRFFQPPVLTSSKYTMGVGSIGHHSHCQSVEMQSVSATEQCSLRNSTTRQQSAPPFFLATYWTCLLTHNTLSYSYQVLFTLWRERRTP
jgi:hypothetical protein